MLKEDSRNSNLACVKQNGVIHPCRGDPWVALQLDGRPGGSPLQVHLHGGSYLEALNCCVFPIMLKADSSKLSNNGSPKVMKRSEGISSNTWG